MKMRRVNAKQIVTARIALVHAGLPHITTDMLEAHALANGNGNGNVPATVNTLLVAKRAGIHLPWERATTLDFAGPPSATPPSKNSSTPPLDSVHNHPQQPNNDPAPTLRLYRPPKLRGGSPGLSYRNERALIMQRFPF